MARKSNTKKAASKKARGKKKGETGRWRQLAGSFLFGEALDDDSSERVRELGGLVLIGMSLWLLLSMATFSTPPEAAAPGSNLGGALGHYLADGALSSVGLAGYLLAALGVLWGSVIVARKEVRMPILRLVGVVFFVLGFAFVLDLKFGPDMESRAEFLQAQRQYVDYGTEGADEVLATFSDDLPYGTGGWLALVSNPGLVERFGQVGLWIVLLTIVGISALLATEMAFYTAITSFSDWLDDRRDRMDEGFLPAIGGWGKRLFVGIWDFLRGADLSPAAATKAKRGGRKASSAKKSTPKKAAAKKPPAKKPKPLPNLDDLEDIDDPDEEYEEDFDEAAAELDEEEYEYVDEDGNPIDPADLDEYEDPDEEEEEYDEDEDEEYEEDELEEDEEWEDEEEEKET